MEPVDPEVLQTALKRALRRGARASRLVKFYPDLVELLTPQKIVGCDGNPYERAVAAEQVLRKAIATLGGPCADAAAELLCLAPGTLGTTLEARRARAAALLSMLPDTFRREQHEGLLLWDVAMAAFAQLADQGVGPTEER